MAVDIQEKADIRKEQLDILYKNLSPSLLTSVVMAIFVSSYAFLEHSGIESFIWLLSLFVVSAARYSTVQRYIKDKNSKYVAEKAYRAYNIGAFAGGAVWGLAPFIMFVDSSLDYKMFLVYSLASISAAALAGYSSSVVTYLCFTAPIVFLTSLNLATSGDELMFMMSLIGLVYFGLLTLTSMRIEQYMLNVLKLSAKSAKLEQSVRNQEYEIKQLQQVIDKEEKALQSEGIWTWEMDTDLVVTALSTVYQSTTGLKVGDLKNKSLDEFESVDELVNRKVRELCIRLKDQQELNGFELPILRTDGTRVYLAITGRPVRDEKNKFLGYKGTGRDVTSQKKAVRQLQYNATHDSLTGLVNRREFYRLLGAELDSKLSINELYVAYIDLERLKIVNETAGHIAGDELLQQLSTDLQESLGENLDLARVGGDEFGLILKEKTLDVVVSIVESLAQQIREFRFRWEEQTFSVGACIGLVPVIDRSITVRELVRHADHACFMAREKGGSGIHIATTNSEKSIPDDKDSTSVQLMFNALDNNRLTLLYQPIANLRTKSISHFEVLLGLKDDAGESDSAGQYLSAAERYGAMAHFDRRVIRDVFRDFHVFQSAHPEAGLFVNLSGSNLDNEIFFDFIREQMARYSVQKEKICFEITETAAVNNINQAVKLINGLKSGGCRFALDDFGTGLASLSYLKQFPVDFVKMDGSFIQHLKNDAVDQAMLRAVAELGKTMRFDIIAESVEDLALIPYLVKTGVSYIQGYGVGYPVSLDELATVDSARSIEPPIKLI